MCYTAYYDEFVRRRYGATDGFGPAMTLDLPPAGSCFAPWLWSGLGLASGDVCIGIVASGSERGYGDWQHALMRGESNMSSADALRVGYVLKRYPRYSETFIVREILAHEAAGLDIEIFS